MLTLVQWLAHASGVLTIIIAVGAAITALGIIWKFVGKPIVAFLSEQRQAAKAMLGYDEVTDPATGRVLQAKTPSMANRVKDLEDAHIKTADALASLAETTKKILDLSADVVDLQGKFQEHEARWQTWISEHETLHTMSAEVKAAVKNPDL